MAAVTNTFVSTSAVGNREELSNVVNRITPEDTPIYSLAGVGSAKTTHPEWEIDELAAPGANVVAEGDTFTYDAITPPTRVGNYTQIMRKTAIVSDTQQAVDNAAQLERLQKQMMKRAIEIRKDAEFAIVSNNASVAGATRELGGLPSWIETNASRGATGANGGFNGGTGLTVAATDGTQRAFTKELLDDTMQDLYEAGGTPKNLVVSPYVKSVFVKFMSDANVAPFRHAVTNGEGNTIIANADMYEGPFGKVAVIPNRVMTTAATSRNAFLIDDDMLSFDWLRKIKRVKDLPKDSDASRAVMLGEGTLCVKNEAGLGVIADVFGLTAST
jgi:hypothetical protein